MKLHKVIAIELQFRSGWRLTNSSERSVKFLNIDSSFTMNVVDNPLNGYIVARAPKGNVRPTYFPQGNSQAIDALMGVGSSPYGQMSP